MRLEYEDTTRRHGGEGLLSPAAARIMKATGFVRQERGPDGRLEPTMESRRRVLRALDREDALARRRRLEQAERELGRR